MSKQKVITLSEAGKLGAKVTNAMLTPEKRKKNALKGWRLRRARLAAEQK